MTKLSLLTIALVASLTTTIFSPDCNNPLLGLYNLAALDDPQSGSDVPYCANLQNGDTCCSADTVSTFQDRLNDLVGNLNEASAGRDLYISQLRNSYFDRFRDILEDIRGDHSDDLRDIRTANAGVADQLQAIIDEANKASTEGNDINRQFVRSLDEYQRSRSTCLEAALRVQSSSWCLACDPNYASQGVDADGNVVFADGLCEALSDACTPFFNQGAAFNPLIRARELYWNLTAVDRYLNDFSDNEVVNDFVIAEDPYNPLASQEGVVVPDAAANTGLCQDLWAGNAQLRELLTVGATVPGVTAENEGARVLQDSLAGDAGVWGPELNETGLDFGGLRLDPGDFFGASDYSDYFNQTQNASDLSDNDRTDDRTDNDLFDRSD